MEKQITITILAEDILLNNYMNCDECPITKALHRAGYSELKDTGSIEGELDGVYICIASTNNDSYREMLTKLFGMYNSEFDYEMRVKGVMVEPIPAEDFTHTLIITI